MKKYNVQNYIRYKKDVEKNIKRIEGKMWDEYTRDELIVKFLPLVENLAKKFSTMQQATGVMTINDLIQQGSVGLIKAVDRLQIEKVIESDDPEKTIKSFLNKIITLIIKNFVFCNKNLYL